MEKGEVIRFWRKRGGWATAIFKRVCERGKRFGLWECETVDGKTIYVRPDEIKAWKGGE